MSSFSILADEILPITRLSKQTKAVLDELGRLHNKFIVMRNNEPTAVLLSLEEYQSLLEDAEDARLSTLAEEREASLGKKRLSMDEVFQGP